MNRELVQMPYRNASSSECEDKTDYHNNLYDLEDQLFMKDFTLFQLKFLKSLVSKLKAEVNLEKTAVLCEKIKRNPVFPSIKVDKLVSNADFELLMRNIEKNEVLIKEKRQKIALNYIPQTKKYITAALDQLLFNQKRRDLKHLMNKSLMNLIEEIFYNRKDETSNNENAHFRTIYKSIEDLALDWIEESHKAKVLEINNKEKAHFSSEKKDFIEEKSEKPNDKGDCRIKNDLFLPMLGQKTFDWAYRLIVQSLFLNKVFMKVSFSN